MPVDAARCRCRLTFESCRTTLNLIGAAWAFAPGENTMPSGPIAPLELRAILQRFSTSPERIPEMCTRALDPAYWLALNPAFTIGETDAGVCATTDGVDRHAIEHAIIAYQHCGFASLRSALSSSTMLQARAAVNNVRSADWPPLFAFVYDQFWRWPSAHSVREFLIRVAGAGVKMRSRFWIHHVFATDGSSGWRPHLDGDSESPHSVTMWVPLGDAGVKTACMFVVEKNDETRGLSRYFHERDAFSRLETLALLKATRPLPADAGDVLFWDEKTLHWGGQHSGDGEPRISVALEFTGVVPADPPGDLYVDPWRELPPFTVRVQSIARSILSYLRFEPLMERFRPLAEGLLHRTQ